MKIWEICRIVSLNSWSCDSRCCRCTFKRHVVQKSEIGDYIRLKEMDVLYLEEKFVRSFLLVKDKLKSAFLALQQPRSSFGRRTRKEPYFRHGKTWFLFKKGECENGNMYDYGIHQSVLLIKKKRRLQNWHQVCVQAFWTGPMRTEDAK